jgi:transaldolase
MADMPTTPQTSLAQLHQAGVSIWLDTLSRELLDSGRFSQLIHDYAVTGVTSNPTIFAKALTESDRYDAQLGELYRFGQHDLQELFFALALDDVRRAARALRPVYDRSQGRDGFVSFECTPDLADDPYATIVQALDLWHRLDEPNVLIKVPATEAGVAAIEGLTRLGVNVNATLLFSLERYEQVIDAFLRGLNARAGAGQDLTGIASVASFFLSRIDTQADAQLSEASPLRGRVALACAHLAYRLFRAKFAGPEWEWLLAQGAAPQLPLWASTGTKNAAYSDVLYVEGLIGPEVINTMPEPTLDAFGDHGEVHATLGTEDGAAEQTLAAAAAAGVDLDTITRQLERAGVQAFCDSYRQLLQAIESRLAGVGHPLPSELRAAA